MTEHPFTAKPWEVRAILEGRMTQFRRPITVPWSGRKQVPPYEPYYVEEDGHLFFEDEYGDFHPMERCCPFGQPGDELWLRETLVARYNDFGQCGPMFLADNKFIPIESGPHSAQHWQWLSNYRNGGYDGPFKIVPSIHMPRWASRIQLRVKSVRAQRVQDISEEDARANGMSPRPLRVIDPLLPSSPCKDNFLFDWECNYGNWRALPWAWAVEFERVKGGRS